jgi:hypothetical protein
MSDISRKEVFLYRQAHANEYIPRLEECLELLQNIKNEWREKLESVSKVATLEDVKKLTAIALHYYTLIITYYREYNIEIINKFIKNPNDQIFQKSSTYEIIIHAIDNLEHVIRRFRYLQLHYANYSDQYYSMFSFNNTSIKSLDMFYGSQLFTLLLQIHNPVLESFVLNAIEKIKELVKYDENVVVLYNLMLTVNKSEIHHNSNVREITIGGGEITDVLKTIGNYVTWCLLQQKLTYSISLDTTIPAIIRIADDHNINIDYHDCGTAIVEYLIFNKHIIPKDYIVYIEKVNSLYSEEEGEEPPKKMVLNFLKGLFKRKIKISNNKISNTKNVKQNRLFRKHTIKVYRKSRNKSQRRR